LVLIIAVWSGEGLAPPAPGKNLKNERMYVEYNMRDKKQHMLLQDETN